MSNLEIGVLSAIPYIAAAVAMVIVGQHSDRTGERQWHTAAPALGGACALAIAAHLATSVSGTVALISVSVLGIFSMMGPFWAMPTALLSGTAAAAGIDWKSGVFGPYMIEDRA